MQVNKRINNQKQTVLETLLDLKPSRVLQTKLNQSHHSNTSQLKHNAN